MKYAEKKLSEGQSCEEIYQLRPLPTPKEFLQNSQDTFNISKK